MENIKIKDKKIFWKIITIIVIAFLMYKWIIDKNNIFSFLKNILNVIKPFLFAILIAYILYIPIVNLENLIKKIKITFCKKYARVFSITLVYFVLFIIGYFAIKMAVPFALKNIKELLKHLPILITKLSNIQKEIISSSNDSILYTLGIVDVIKGIKPESIKEAILKSVNFNEIVGQLFKAFKISNIIFDAFVSIIVSIYMLNSRDEISGFLEKVAKAFFDSRKVRIIRKYIKLSNEIFFKYLTAQIFDAILVGIITAIAMSVIKVKYAIFLGALIGFMNLIPFFGAIIGVGISAIITFLTGGTYQSILMLVVVTILQQIDANIINPMILGNALDLNKILIILSVTIGGAFFGGIGMFLAVPFTTIISIMIVDYLEYKINTREKKKNELIKVKKNITMIKKKINKLEKTN